MRTLRSPGPRFEVCQARGPGAELTGSRRLGIALNLASMSAISRGKWREPASKTIPEIKRAGITTSMPAVRF